MKKQAFFFFSSRKSIWTYNVTHYWADQQFVQLYRGLVAGMLKTSHARGHSLDTEPDNRSSFSELRPGGEIVLLPSTPTALSTQSAVGI